MLVVVALYGSVGGLVFIVAVRGYQDRGHHGQGAESRGYHVAHDVSVVVLAGPDVTALGFHDTGYGVVNQGVEIGDSGSFKFFSILAVENLLEDILEGMVIFFGNGILCGEPEVLFCIQGIVEAASGKAFNGLIDIVHALYDARAGEVVNQFPALGTIHGRVNQLHLSRTRYLHLRTLVDIAVGMSGNGDGFLPVLNTWFDSLYYNRGAEHGTVQDGADGSVGALPHFLQVVFLHAGGVGGDGGTFNSHAVLFGGIGGINGYLVVSLIPVFQSKVIVLCL